jgi:hypothetical protein
MLGLAKWPLPNLTISSFGCSVTGGELFEDIVAREYYSEADARWDEGSVVLVQL